MTVFIRPANWCETDQKFIPYALDSDAICTSDDTFAELMERTELWGIPTFKMPIDDFLTEVVKVRGQGGLRPLFIRSLDRIILRLSTERFSERPAKFVMCTNA